jgi:Fe-S-cluster containining protein
MHKNVRRGKQKSDLSNRPAIGYLFSPLKNSEKAQRPPAASICQSCGLCCDGTLFADVKLVAGDSPEALRALGFRLEKTGVSNSPRERRSTLRFAQPCYALQGCLCRVYAERPRYCHEFECLVLKNLLDGRLQPAAAVNLIHAAKERAARVRELLRELGDTDESAPLTKRFRRTSERMEDVGLDNQSADLYGELTLAFHDLNFLLSESFYPGES